MTAVLAKLFIDVHSSEAKLAVFLDGNCFLIASTRGLYSSLQMLLSVPVDGGTNVDCNAIYDLS